MAQMFELNSGNERTVLLNEIKNHLLAFDDNKHHMVTLKKVMHALEQKDIDQIVTDLLQQQDDFIRLIKGENSYRTISKLFNMASDHTKSKLFDKAVYKQDIMELGTGRFSSRFICSLMPSMVEQDKSLFLEKIRDEMMGLARDANGVFVLKEFLKTANANVRDELFNSLRPHYVELCSHEIGRYFIQACLEMMQQFQLMEFLYHLQNDFKYLCCTPYGSVIIRHFIKVSQLQFNKFLFDEILMKNIVEYAKNVHACFVIEEIAPSLDRIEKKKLFNMLAEHILELGEQKSSSIFLQKLIHLIDADSVTELIHQIKPHIYPLCKSYNGSFVVQSLFNKVESKSSRRELIQSISPHLVSLALDKNGSKFLQYLVKILDMSEMDTNMLITVLLNNFSKLAASPSGSHVIQSIVNKGFADMVYIRMRGKLQLLSMQATSSFVILACMKECSKNNVHSILLELLMASPTDISKKKVLTLANNPHSIFILKDSMKILHEHFECADQLLTSISEITKTNKKCLEMIQDGSREETK